MALTREQKKAIFAKKLPLSKIKQLPFIKNENLEYFDRTGKKLDTDSPRWNIDGTDSQRIKMFRIKGLPRSDDKGHGFTDEQQKKHIETLHNVVKNV